jgi:aspartyl-tRNA synthetase
MQVCDIVDRLFMAMFDHLNKYCSKELETINRQYPFQPLKVMTDISLFGICF